MKRALFLQELRCVSREETREMLAAAGCPHGAVWAGDPEVEGARDQVEVLVTAEHRLDAAEIDRWPALEMASLAFTGYDQVDLDHARERGVRVYYVPGYATDSVAELTVALTLALLRKVVPGDRDAREGGWDARVIPGVELAGKTVGVAGTGTIGLATARLFRAFGCSLLGWSRSRRREFIGLGGAYVSWQALFAESDVVALHLPLGEETRGIVAAAELAAMRPGSLLVNTARGPLVERQALLEALETGRISAGLDVFDTEPFPGHDELSRLENVVLAPHVGFKTREALRRLAAITIANIGRYLSNDPTNRLA